MDPTLALTAGALAVAGVVWLVRLEGRINVLTARQDAMEKRLDGMDDRIFAQLDRIEQKLDGKADK